MADRSVKAISDFRMSLHGLPYDQTEQAKPPVKIATLSSSRLSEEKSTKARDSRAASLSNTSEKRKKPLDVENGSKKNEDSALSDPSNRGSQSSLRTNGRVSNSITAASIPKILVEDETAVRTSKEEPSKPRKLHKTKKSLEAHTRASKPGPQQPFQGLSLSLESKKFGEELLTSNMEFSKRGSMFIDGRKVSAQTTTDEPVPSLRPLLVNRRIPTSASVPDRMPLRIMSTDEEQLSEKVRIFYAQGSDGPVETGNGQVNTATRLAQGWQNELSRNGSTAIDTARRSSSAGRDAPPSPASSNQPSVHSFAREKMELAGGTEDWANIDNAEVDRYGFIVPQTPGSRSQSGSNTKKSTILNGANLQRVSTSLQVASETPRRKGTIRRSPSTTRNDGRESPESRKSFNSTRSATIGKLSKRGTNGNGQRSAARTATYILTGNKDRRVLDEAADMLTLPRSLNTPSAALSRVDSGTSDGTTTINTSDHFSRATSTVARRKESEREEKWRRMATAVPLSGQNSTTETKGIGGGQMFSFPSLTDPKLISRTWKGIPDAWRASAWFYFLSVSARKYPKSLSDENLTTLFHDYQAQNSPDDVQIDIDVPRTISSHIMFRRRYRGGQRLLFRVLHAMSLHWPETGYVQGMAALAATLLAYYEEERAFIMLVRLWDVRGLGRLYKEGFGGLMEALSQFEKEWLGEGEVAMKLSELNIGPTAYGTKWYLTLFNYSIPFPAQLRVWDVFMLLGDDSGAPVNADPSQRPDERPFGGTLDVLHATSAALIDGMRDIIMESDFENSMKVLTSWIPIRDEDLFMRVARAEWNLHRTK